MLINNIKVKYVREGVEKIGKISTGDWIDLRSAVDIELKRGEFYCIPLGVAMQLPEFCEAIIAPRSSTFKKWGIIQTNSIGIIDESYCGDNDEWCLPVLAVRDTRISKNDRICQFRIFHHQPLITFTCVDSLNNKDRGGFGSTGEK